jgi:hypothetical protein
MMDGDEVPRAPTAQIPLRKNRPVLIEGRMKGAQGARMKGAYGAP